MNQRAIVVVADAGVDAGPAAGQALRGRSLHPQEPASWSPASGAAADPAVVPRPARCGRNRRRTGRSRRCRRQTGRPRSAHRHRGRARRYALPRNPGRPRSRRSRPLPAAARRPGDPARRGSGRPCPRLRPARRRDPGIRLCSVIPCSRAWTAPIGPQRGARHASVAADRTIARGPRALPRRPVGGGGAGPG